MREILNIDPKKATTGKSIPSETLKLSADISAGVLQNLFNDMLSIGNFPDNMKYNRHNTCIQEKRPFKKENYRPVSILSAISQIFEKLIQKQIVRYMENFLSPYLRGYRKKFNIKQAFLALTENWKKVLDNKSFGGAVLRDLSKAFDTINHDLLIAKTSRIWFQQ